LLNQIQLPSVKKVVSTTEKLRERDVIGTAFQCPVYDQYGSREILSIAAELDPVGAPGVMSVFDDTVSLDVGRNNRLIVSALHSYGFPLINYEIGDCGNPLPCKAVNSDIPFSSFSLTIGRDTDNFINHKNELISSSALSTWMSTHKIYIKEQQIIQHGLKNFEISYVVDSGFEKKHYEKVIQACLETYFGDQLALNFIPCDEIPFEKSGKKLMFKRMFEI